MSPAFTLLALAGASWPSQSPLLCYTSLGGMEPPLAVTVQMNVDEAHRLRSVDLAAGDGAYVAFWPIDRASPARRTAMRDFMFWVQLPVGAVMPVTISLSSDQGPVWTGRFETPSGVMAGYRPDGTVSETGLTHLSFVEGPYILVGGGREGPVREIVGLRWLRARATDTAGTTIAVRQINFPDWASVARQIPRSLRELERRRQRHSCNPPPIP